jgi:hypothetical protein
MLIKVHVTGGDDAVRNRIIAAVAFGVSRVTEENTRNGTRGEFMRSGGGDTRITTTTENPKTVVGWRGTVKEVMRCIVPAGTTRTKVDKEGGGG